MAPSRPDPPLRSGHDPFRRPGPGEEPDYGTTELVDGGSTRRPWGAYVVVALLVLAGLGLGVHKLVTAHHLATTSSPTSSAGTATAKPRASAPSTPPDRSQRRPAPLRPVGLSMSYGSLFAEQVPGADACVRSGAMLAIRPGLRAAGAPTTSLSAQCHRPSSAMSIVLRRDDGSFGEHSAIISYPAVTMDPGRTSAPTTHDGKTGYWRLHGLTWQVRGVYVQVQGDLPRAGLARIALAVKVTGGRSPQLRVAPVPGYHAEWTGPSNGVGYSLASYTATSLGYQPALGSTQLQLGLWTGISLEASLYSDPTNGVIAPVVVHGQHGVLMHLSGGGVAVAWQVPPYAAAIVQCLACSASRTAEAALRQIAQTTDLYALKVPVRSG